MIDCLNDVIPVFPVKMMMMNPGGNKQTNTTTITARFICRGGVIKGEEWSDERFLPSILLSSLRITCVLDHSGSINLSCAPLLMDPLEGSPRLPRVCDIFPFPCL
jgi:hypothetical protein